MTLRPRYIAQWAGNSCMYSSTKYKLMAITTTARVHVIPFITLQDIREKDISILVPILSQTFIRYNDREVVMHCSIITEIKIKGRNIFYCYIIMKLNKIKETEKPIFISI